MAWINLSEDYEFTDHALENFKNGQVLTFDYEGSQMHMKVKRIDGKKVWVTEVKLSKKYTDELELAEAMEKGSKLTK